MHDLQPAWSPRPPRELAGVNYQIVRSNKKNGLNLTMIALGDIVGAATHWKQQTYPCMKPRFKCPFCVDGHRARWCGYFAAWWPHERRKVACEITPSAVPAFDEYAKNRGTIRGAEVRLRRVNNRPNGLLVASLEPAELSPGQVLPTAFDVQDCLTKTWGYERHAKRCELADPDDNRMSYEEAILRFQAANGEGGAA